MRLSMSRDVTRGDHLCWDQVMIIWAHGDCPFDGEVMIIIWACGDRPCEFWLIYDSAVKSFTQTCGDCLCQYMDLVSSLLVELSMYFRGVSYIYNWQSTEYSEAYRSMVWYWIASHDILHFWWMCFIWLLEVTWCLITSIWWNLTGKCNIDFYN